MVVQHNMQAMNANRMLNVTTNQQSKSTEKLSSGYRINRAADDAAGLSISEKMRKQIRGLDQASTNAEDGVSAVQTAEGALTEVHSMLQRMNELAVQAANGTNSESDRQSIQDEIDQLTTEIDRVSETTKFNETYLLKGNSGGTSSDVKVSAHDAGLAGKLTDNGNGTSTFKLDSELTNGSKITIAGTEYTIGVTKTDDDFSKLSDAIKTSANTPTVLKSVGDSAVIDGSKSTVVGDVSVATVAAAANWSTNDTFIDKDGVTWTVASATDLTNHEVKAADVATYLTAGSTITKCTKLEINDGTKNTAMSANVVNALDEGEVSIVDSTSLDALRAKITAGDTVTVDGTTTTVYDDATNTGGVKSFSVLSDEVKQLIDDGTASVTITHDGTTKTYNIVTKENEDPDSNKLSAEDILAKISEGDSVKVDSGNNMYVYGVDDTTDEDTITVEDAYRKIASELKDASSIGTDTGKEASVTSNGDGTFTITQGSVELKDSLSFNLHVGADADMTNKITVNIDSMSAAGLGVKGLNVKDDSGVAATYAIDAIADAISKVSEQRSALGAVQNRLEHTINNLDNVVENTTSAESRIRDTDMAEEMVEYSKNNILAQAGQSMLAQANQSNQGVLSLLG